MESAGERCTALLTWYRRISRDLPWRATKDPYRIWVSEIMLQQTRVETVIGYYRRFLACFPDVHTLANAPEIDVLKCWEGLGYYSRARNMQHAAQAVVHLHEGRFPATAEGLRKLPGIGAYTAGAVASIAFGEATPAIDGNVKRVIARLLGIREPIEAKASQIRLYADVAAMLRACDPGECNQALMELGAMCCRPRAPKCDQCPLTGYCDAFAEGDQENLPVFERKPAPVEVPIAVCLLTYGQQVLVVKRSERLLHGLYVFTLLQDADSPQQAQAMLLEQGLDVRFSEMHGEAKHVFTHRVWRMRLYHYILRSAPDAAWQTAHHAMLANRDGLENLPFPTAMKTAKEVIFRILAGASNTNLPKDTSFSARKGL